MRPAKHQSFQPPTRESRNLLRAANGEVGAIGTPVAAPYTFAAAPDITEAPRHSGGHATPRLAAEKPNILVIRVRDSWLTTDFELVGIAEVRGRDIAATLLRADVSTPL